MKINGMLFVFLIAMAVTLVGCGSSGSNPLRNGSGDVSIVRVDGRLSNVSSPAKVYFYTVEGAIKSVLNTSPSIRGSLNEDGVYTFNSNSDGSFSAYVPEGEYYVIATDGEKKAVTEKKSFALRASSVTLPDIVLAKTYDVSGKLLSSSVPVGNIMVYIENKPFATVTDSTGTFKLTSVPMLETTASPYVLCAYLNYSGVSFSARVNLDNEKLVSGNEIHLTMTSNGGAVPSSKYVSGKVYSAGSKIGLPDIPVYAISNSTSRVYTANTGLDGGFDFSLTADETALKLTLDMLNFTDVLAGDDSVVLYENKRGALTITESLSDFGTNSFAELELFRVHGSQYVPYKKERVYLPVNHKMSDLPLGRYSYCLYINDKVSDKHLYKLKGPFEVTSSSNSSVTADESMIFDKSPRIKVDNSGYTACFPVVTNTGNKAVHYKAYAVNRDTEDEVIKLSLGDRDPNNEAKIDLSAIMNIGEYKIFVEFGFTHCEKSYSVKSNPCPYVKH